MTNVGTTTDLRSVRFRREREAGWKRLEALVAQVERKGMRHLSFDEARELTSTYRQTINSLSVAREISLDHALLTYLENLAARAYLVIYAPQASIGSLITKLLVSGIPHAFRRSVPVLTIGFGLMIIGALIGFALVSGDSTWFYTFVPGELAGDRGPGASRAALETSLFGQDTLHQNALAAFAAYLISHNTQVAILCFALGVFWTLPTAFLTFYNGTILGAFVAVFAEKGLGYEVFGWLSIHGVTEISAICVAAAGGAQLGLAMLLPGEMTRKDALRVRGRDATKLLILAAIMLFAAGILEGFLRQLVQSTELRLLIGWGAGALWLCWLLFSGRGAKG
ncbi:stage II sporulation protein M [Yoonia sediminilitoris]|uniref:Putative membrane protein SpoIIM required for sporulation n=1 Tax=Yoonia sediminilitoris TaxID=1286148 RepID=A0A2T6KMV6_9RHOB|nr:stage II sporulation protein M [Yoonia sediminilitoris]PUB17487.1 putative membrane protein SpoIIM required for sporulation [Yoonia sediminilitoris]RCW97782.1 putative membrane protein SpoIIM required for sporulation [Yoonia sediminilitoris]